MRKNLLGLFVILSFQFSYSQSYTYSSSGEYEYDQNSDSFKFLENTYEESKTTVDVDENLKEILVSRIFKSVNTGLERTGQKYYYVKKEFVKDSYRYYAIDLIQKKYVEFIITSDKTSMAEDCNGFTGCNKVITFLK